MADWLESIWYGKSAWRYALSPLSLLYCLVFRVQKWTATKVRESAASAAVPVIVVGNITLGGTGKTPLTIALIQVLKTMGYRPGVISRGYGGKPPYLPYPVNASDDPGNCGDEPLLISKESGTPVVVDPDRCRALNYLLQQYDCNIVVSDDGLQHHRLPRDLEIIVIDGKRRLGNGWCLPAGPLREAPSRLASVDYVISNGVKIPETDNVMTLKPLVFQAVDGEKTLALNAFNGQAVNAIAGIGNPRRFFDTLRTLGIKAKTREFADHHHYQASDFNFDDQLPLLMTSKDAIKCTGLGLANAWYLRIEAELEESLLQEFKNNIKRLMSIRFSPVK